MSDQLMVVEDARQDARFRDNPLVTGYPNIRFYAGMPLINGEGFALGSLCVIDQNPRTLTDAQAFCLYVLGRQVVHYIELRKKVRQYQQAQQCLKAIASMQSHKVRGSLSSILGLLQLINQEGLSDENKEYVALLNATALKMDHTISTIVHTSSEEICQGKV
jgi:GAF domain-containing protein